MISILEAFRSRRKQCLYLFKFCRIYKISVQKKNLSRADQKVFGKKMKMFEDRRKQYKDRDIYNIDLRVCQSELRYLIHWSEFSICNNKMRKQANYFIVNFIGNLLIG